MDASRTQTSPLIAALRGDRDLRPIVDPMLAGGLRAWLEDELAEAAGRLDASQPLRLSPFDVLEAEAVAQQIGPRSPVGPLVHALVDQQVAFGSISDPLEDALCALEASPRHTDIVEQVHGLDPDDFSQLAAELEAHASVLAESLGRIPGTWLPCCRIPVAVSLAGGRVQLSAMVDLKVGSPTSTVASVCLLDVSTAPLRETTAGQLGLLALIETLRSGAAPLRVGALSTATGEVLVLDVDDALLSRALRALVFAIESRLGTEVPR